MKQRVCDCLKLTIAVSVTPVFIAGFFFYTWANKQDIDRIQLDIDNEAGRVVVREE
jgi:hypothetical protein